MKISCGTFENRFRTEYPGITGYRPHKWFVGSGPLWDELIAIVTDKTLISHILFCNDVLGIQPVYTHMMISKYRGGEADSRKLTDDERKALGAAYGFLFRFVFGYTDVKELSCPLPYFKKAALFFREDKTPVEFVDSGEEPESTLE